MKSKKLLQEIYDKTKGNNQYYSFDLFCNDAKEYIKDIKNRNTFCHITPSKSGMSRTFNYHKYNILFNICYNQKFSHDAFRVSGCGMDMHWALQFETIETLCTEKEIKKEIEKNNFNSLCSGGHCL